MVTLYHFTSPKHVIGCRLTGLKYGMLPVNDQPVKMLKGYQWLTENCDKAQSWNEGSSLPYDRTAFRLTVEIPKHGRSQLIKWVPWGRKLTRIADVLEEYGDPENWWLYRGRIPPTWITEAVDMRTQEVTP